MDYISNRWSAALGRNRIKKLETNMVNILIVTEVIDCQLITPFIFSKNNCDIGDLEKIKATARSEALSRRSEAAYALPNQTVILAEEPFPCFDKA